MVDKPLRGGDWTGVLLSNYACGLSHFHPARFGLAWSGRDSHRDYCYPGISFYVRLASGGGLSYGSPAAASDRPSRLILIWLYLYVASHVSFT